MARAEKVFSASRQPILRSNAAQKLLAFAALIVIFAVFSFLSPFFATPENVVGILLATAVNGVLALGVTFVIVTAGIDLSVGTVMTLSAVMTGLTVSLAGWPVPLGILIGVLTGSMAGLINGLIISRMQVPPFIATLGMMMVARGLALVLSTLETGTIKPIYFNDVPVFRQLMMGSILSPLLAPVAPDFNLPNAVLILFVAALVAAFVLAKTVLGRYTVAIGSNEEATRLSGVGVAGWKTAVYALGGTFSGLAGGDDCFPSQLGPTSAGGWVRVGCDCSGGDRGHVAERGAGNHFGDDHRRIYYQHPDQRPAHHERAARVAVCGDGADRDFGGLSRHLAPSAQLKRL